jgi:hypothetical protein
MNSMMSHSKHQLGGCVVVVRIGLQKRVPELNGVLPDQKRKANYALCATLKWYLEMGNSGNFMVVQDTLIAGVQGNILEFRL